MSAPVQRDETFNSSDARLYAPPWARERPLPAAGQPQYTNSPPVASADDATDDSSPPKERVRMPRGVGGPNIPWAPKAPANDGFTGDVAIQALRRRLSLEPDAVPQPPIVVRRDPPFPWIARLGFVCLAAGVAAFGITALSVTEVYSPIDEQERPLRQRRRIHAGTSRTTTSTWRPHASSSRAAAPPRTVRRRSAFRSRIRPAGSRCSSAASRTAPA